MKNLIWTFMNILLTFSKENVKIWWFSSKNRRYAQNHGRNGKIWSLKYGLLRFVEPCSNKKPKASYTDCPNCQHLWRTLYELLWTFYEHFLKKMSKFDDVSQKPKISSKYGRNGKIWSLKYGLLRFVEPCSNKKPEASYTYCPNCVHLWRTLYELLWTFLNIF